MPSRPRASLGRILDDLGTTLLDLVCGDPDLESEIGGIVIHDPLDDQAHPRHAIVLGVGLHGSEHIAALLAEIGTHGAAALVVREPVRLDDTLVRAANRSGVTLLGLTRGASWTQLAALLRSLLAEGDVGVDGPQTLGGIPSGDLFAVANAVAALLDAPITIEDRSSRVLAFSGRQDEADASRVETILGRQVPERYGRLLADRGVFRDLYRSDQPVYVEPPDGDGAEFAVPRVALAVRAGDEVLGSIWAAVREPLSSQRTRALCDAARLVALHMLSIRAGADVGRRLRADLVSTALEGGSGAREAAHRLGLADQPTIVLALAVLDPQAAPPRTDADVATERQRVADAFAMHMSAVHPRCAAALIGGVAYGILPVTRDLDASGRAVAIADEFLARTGERAPACIGVGPVAADAGQLAHSRDGADRALRALQANGRAHAASLADVYVDSLLVELRDLVAVRGDAPTGPIARLADYDAKHRTGLVETLRAWLDAFGDVTVAASALFVHPNTFRYRLRRLSEVGGIDLDDPHARFTAMVQLRLVSPRPASAKCRESSRSAAT